MHKCSETGQLLFLGPFLHGQLLGINDHVSRFAYIYAHSVMIDHLEREPGPKPNARHLAEYYQKPNFPNIHSRARNSDPDPVFKIDVIRIRFSEK